MTRKSREPITEKANVHSASLDLKSTLEILRIISREDQRVAPAVRKTIPQIARAVDLAVEAIRKGGRVVYTGAGSSGRLGVLDAAECVPTFGSDRVQAILAGAPASFRRAVEGVEDNPDLGVRDLEKIRFNSRDLLVGISAGGRAEYVLGALHLARRWHAKTVALTCDPESPLAKIADVVICPVVGPEVIAGSSRMKAGTAQKLVLNMLSTAVMVRLGRVLSNRMINVQLSNQKVAKRAEAMLREFTGAKQAEAAKLLKTARGNLPVALLMALIGIPRSEAAGRLRQAPNVAKVLRDAITAKTHLGRR